MDNITITIFGHFNYNDDYLTYLRYLLYSLPDELKKCKFLIIFDTNNKKTKNSKLEELEMYFENRNEKLNYEIFYSNFGLIDSVNIALKKIKTEYFIFLEYDWVFLDKDTVDFEGLIKCFNKYQFVNSVWFNAYFNKKTLHEYAPNDINFKETYFGLEEKIEDFQLTNTIRFLNSPSIHRTKKYKQWFNKYIDVFENKVSDITPDENGHYGSNGLEEVMIKRIRDLVHANDYNEVRYYIGTYLYGKPGDGPITAHTDGTKRKFDNPLNSQFKKKSLSEINGDYYILTNELPKND
jgi:hypothetical protein